MLATNQLHNIKFIYHHLLSATKPQAISHLDEHKNEMSSLGSSLITISRPLLVVPTSSILWPTCVQSILLWAPGERSDAQEAGEVSLRPLDSFRLLLREGAGITAPAGWKKSAGRWNRGEMPLAPPSPSLFLSLLLLLETPPWGGNTLVPFLSIHVLFTLF